MQKCPCNTHRLYKECCYPFHVGQKAPQTPLELMKSRYSAYAMQLSDYIIETTHLKNPAYQKDIAAWRASIENFSLSTLFLGLEILEHTHEGNEGYVTFFAKLEQNSKDASFKERSHFLCENGKWLYHSGVVEKAYV